MGNLGLVKLACVLFAVCISIGSPAQSFKTLYSFCSQTNCTDGEFPDTGLIQGNDGNLYGTTSGGGAYGSGTVFKITPIGTLTTLYSFCSQTNCADGAVPSGLVQATDGNFYGTTFYGGNDSCNATCGTVFKITPTGTLTTLYSFCSQTNCADGEFPDTGLIQGNDGNFYGTTSSGGSGNCSFSCSTGTVFKITPTGTLTTLYSFCSQTNCADGANPSGLVQATDGNFYGTTYAGGVNNCIPFDSIVSCGSIFKITPTGMLTTLYSFCSQTNCTDGANPTAGLIQASDGNLYGTTHSVGANGGGTVFEITLAGVLTPLYSFCSQTNCTDGANPTAGLIQASDGNFYGTTSYGGVNTNNKFCNGSCGVIFELTPFTDMLTTLYSFCSRSGCTDGARPSAALLQGTDGNFYGTTERGGAFNHGTVFTFGPPAVTLSPTSLSFGNQALDETSTAKTVTLTNSGTALLTISTVSISGDFAISTNTCTGAALTMGKKCKVSVNFTPTALGKRAGTLMFTDNAANSPQTVPLSGTGIAQATLSPASATWAPQTVGTTSAAKTFTLTNNQTVALTSIAISTTGNFAVSATTCTTSLAAKAKCTISVTFTPTQIGTRVGKLIVSDSANNSPQTSTLAGTGK